MYVKFPLLVPVLNRSKGSEMCWMRLLRLGAHQKKKNTQPLPCSSYTTTTTTSSSAPAQQQLGSSRLLSWKLSLT
jgi:hypothetical protein